MKSTNLFGIVLILMGISIISAGVIYPMTVTDITPPSIWDTQPIDGGVYQPNVLTYVSMWARDDESYINCTSAYFILEGEDPINLDEQPSQPKAYPRGAAFEKSGLPMLSAGTYSFRFRVKNQAGLTNELSGTFQISGDDAPPILVEGKWYINDVEIASWTQTVSFSTTNTLNFKFIKTGGLADSYITCDVRWAGPETGESALINSATATWTCQHLFESGIYAIMLTAGDDGTRSVIMAIYDVQVGVTDDGANGVDNGDVDDGIYHGPEVGDVTRTQFVVVIIGVAVSALGGAVLLLPKKFKTFSFK